MPIDKRPLRWNNLTQAKLAVFLILFVSYVGFMNAVLNPNSLSRIGLTINLVQHGRVDIDEFAPYTEDKAFRDGKYYSDKAPGMSFLSTAIAYLFTRLLPIDFVAIIDDTMWRRISDLVWACTIATSGLLTALAGVALFSFTLAGTKSFSAALVAALTYGLATPTWGWATTLFGHAAAGAFLVLAFLAAEKSVAPSRGGNARGAFAGLLLGAAITTEFTAAVPAAIIGTYLAGAMLSAQGLKATLVRLLCLGSGAALALLPLLWYNLSAFGSPFVLGYANVVGFEGMQTGFFGISLPNLHVLFAILFGFYRGIIWVSPIAGLAIYAAFSNVILSRHKLPGAVIALIVCYYFVVNAGYTYWDGGSSTGPRHITPIFPFLAIALSIWFTSAQRWMQAVVWGILAASVIINLACVSVAITAPARFSNPLVEFIWPRFASGDLRATVLHKFGMPGWWQLPLLASAWLILGTILWRNWMPAPLRAPAPVQRLTKAPVAQRSD